MPPEPPLPAVGGGAGGAGGEEPPIWRGGSSEVAPDPRRPPAGSTREGRPEREMRREAARNEADELYKLQSQLTADRVAAKHFLDEVNEKFPMNPASQERIYHNIEEGDRNVPLTQAEKSYRDNIVRPLIEEGARVLQDIRGQGHPIDTDGYIHRITKNKGSMYDRMEGQRGRDVMGRRGLGRKTGAMEQLTMQGTTRDIEATTDVRYHKNALANSMDNLLRLKQVRRSIDYLKAMKPRLEEAGFATRPGVRPPSQRFQTTDIPQLQGWHFEPRIAHVLNDFYGSGQRGDSVFSAVNRVLTRAIVLNPLYHSWNVLNDWGIARGWDWLSPPGWASLGRDGFRALRDVASMNGNYLRVLRGGAGLRYGDAATRNFLEMMLKQMGGEIERNPTRWQQIARVTGFNSARELGRWIADKTNRSMFMIGDTFLVHRIYELQNKGMTLPEAIKEAEKHINNYRIPSEIMGSRRMSEFLQNRSLDAFSGYHYGLFKSYANMIKDVVKGTPAQRKVAAGQLLMLGLAVFVGYPLATAALRYITGDKDATVRRGGVPGLAQGAIDLMAPHRAVNLLGTNLELTQGQRDFTSELQSLITPAPALYLGGELATNTDFFTKQPIYDTQNLGHAGVEVGRKLLGEAPMARDIIDELIGRRGLGRIVGEEALPIRLPSPQDVMRRKKAEIERQKEMSRIWKSTKRALGLTGPAPTPDTGAPQ